MSPSGAPASLDLVETTRKFRICSVARMRSFRGRRREPIRERHRCTLLNLWFSTPDRLVGGNWLAWQGLQPKPTTTARQSRPIWNVTIFQRLRLHVSNRWEEWNVCLFQDVFTTSYCVYVTKLLNCELPVWRKFSSFLKFRVFSVYMPASSISSFSISNQGIKSLCHSRYLDSFKHFGQVV